jgi:hypothetical protein
LTESWQSKDGINTVATNYFLVTNLTEHGLQAETKFYTDTQGNGVKADTPNALEWTATLVMDFDKHSLTKVLIGGGQSLSYHLVQPKAAK